jgi:hypothetical protein
MPYELLDDEPTVGMPQKSKTLGESILHGVKHVGARAIKSAYTAPGDILGLGLDAVNFLSKHDPTLAPETKERGLLKTYGINNPLPTSESVKLPEGYESQNEYEEFLGEVADNAISFLTPSKKVSTIAKSIPKALAISGVGNIGSWVAKQSGLGPLGQSGAKAGTTIIAGMLGGRRKLLQEGSHSYNKMDDIVKSNPQAKIPARNLENSINKVLHYTNLGSPTKDKELLKTLLEPIKNNIGNNFISLEQLDQFKRDLNKYIYDPETSKTVKKFLNDIKPVAKQSLSKWSRFKKNDYSNLMNTADEIYSSIADSELISKYIGKAIPKKYLNGIQNPIVKWGIVYPLGIAQYGLPAAGAAIANESSRALTLLYKSPIARETYFSMGKNILAGNTLAVKKNIKKLESIADRFEDKEGEGKYQLLS